MEVSPTETTEPLEQTPDRPRRLRVPGFFIGCLVGGVFTLLIFLVLGVMVRREAGAYPHFVQAIFGADRPTAIESGTGTLSVEQLQAIRGVKPSFEIMLSEGDINSYLQEHPDALGLPKGYAAPRVSFEDGQMKLSVRTKVLLWPVRVEVWMRPMVVDEELAVEIVKVQAGRVSLPGEFRQQVQAEMERLLAAQLTGAGVTPLAVEVGEGRLTVTVQLRPI